MPKHAAPLPPELRAAPFTVQQAVSARLTTGRLRRRDLDREFRGVRERRRAGPIPERVDELARRSRLFLVGKPTNWAVSGPTAAILHGLYLPRFLERDERLHLVAIDAANAPREAGIAGRRTGLRVPVRYVDGVRVVAPEYAWASLAPLLDDEVALVIAGERLWDPFAPLATVATVDAMLSVLRNWNGISRLRAARMRMRAGSHSPRETRMRLNFERHGVPTGVPNGRIAVRSGRTYYGDLVLREYRIVFEYDGDWHWDEKGRRRPEDLRRQNELAAEGWLLVRFASESAEEEQVAMARAALRSRGWRQADGRGLGASGGGGGGEPG